MTPPELAPEQKAELPPDQKTALKKFISTVELKQICLVAVSAHCNVPPPTIVPDQIKTNLETEAQFATHEGTLGVWSTLTLKGSAKDGEEVFLIEGTFLLIYDCETESFDNNVLGTFAERNGKYNAWPYHRELIQATMARMQIPPLILPLMNPYRNKSSKNK